MASQSAINIYLKKKGQIFISISSFAIYRLALYFF